MKGEDNVIPSKAPSSLTKKILKIFHEGEINGFKEDKLDLEST